MRIGRDLLYVCIALCYPALAVWAVGLGDLTIRSTLDTPLKAEINLLSDDQIDISDLKVGPALVTEFDDAGIARVDHLVGLKFMPSFREDGGAIVIVTSSQPMSEPYFQLLVALEWTNGRMVREYTILIDPPIHGKTTPARIIGPEIPSYKSTVNPTRRDILSLGTDGQSWSYGPVQRGDYLIAIAEIIDVPESVSIYQLLYGLFISNSHGFINSNMNLLKAGVVLDIPAIAAIEDISRVLAMETFTRHVIEWQEYRARFGNLGDTNDQLAERAAGMELMQETVEELEREILTLRAQIDETNAINLQQGRELSKAVDSRGKLLDDIDRLQSARDELLLTIEDMSVSAFSSTKDNPDALDEQPDSEGSDVYLDAPSVDLRAVNSSESAMLNKEISELRSQIRLLEGRISEAMALIKTQDEELVVARQQVEVYGSALEALQSTDNDVVSNGGHSKLSDQSLTVNVSLPLESDNDEKVQASSKQSNDPTGEFSNQSDDSNSDTVLEGESALAANYWGSRLSFLSGLALIGLLLLFILLRLRLRRAARMRLYRETPSVIVSDVAGGGRVSEPRISSKVNTIFQSESKVDQSGDVISNGQVKPMDPNFEEENKPVEIEEKARVPNLGESHDSSGMATKLDLARAYFEMGDHQMALELIQEVENSGDQDEKNEAFDLKEKLGF
ncbi:MAG: hypothetical protein CL398_04010 [Acidiferrobacteraceae bacterium]|nr:hypothetical protein [Acidiferrobacteraceae bacterium]